jgi:ribosomal protein S18 acetylase RimI-like enzyme
MVYTVLPHETTMKSVGASRCGPPVSLTSKWASGTFSKRPDFGYWSSPFAGRLPPMSVNYFKRYRMELDLRGRRFLPVIVPPGYRLLAWHAGLIDDHAVAKFESFRNEIDAGVFDCLADLPGCQRLMQEISQKDGFLPEATWLAACTADGPFEYCGTIQGIRATHKYGAIQNVGITPQHRGRGVGTALITAALIGFQQVGLPRAYLEVTAQNDRAVRLYKRLGFRRTKTLFKAVELAYS